MGQSDFLNKLDIVKGPLKSFAYNLTRNNENAKDLLQDTTFRAIRNKDKFQPGTNFKAWMFTIMKNIFINDLRKSKRRNTFLDSTDNNFFLNSGSIVVTNGVGSHFVMEEIGAMINKLDETLRAPFMMHFEGYKYHEIADHFELPLGTIKSRIFYARKELKKRIIAHYGDLHTIREKMTA